ncbi:glycosyl hydrolase family 28 protein [Seonamhaeicola sp.]|uniref:glycoside hydrolase family 28 protein n=1 Tax=Seonamhaeicola sp. TaxID=1912245 RepID=UPI002626CB2F|nr:glycosyl hydrolase family 28 protein [Seonamhaeicola sp.]
MKKVCVTPCILLAFIIITVFSCKEHPTSPGYNVLEFGAIGDGITLNTGAIQEAIDKCHEAGGGQVIIPSGTFLSGTITLKDNVKIHFENGATLLASENHDDFPRQIQPEYRSQKDIGGWYALIYAHKVKNIAITGHGIVDGQGAKQKPRPYEAGGDKDGRPRNILFISCSEVVVKDIYLKNSGIWNQHYLNCEDVLVDGIKVWNHGNRNNDGIDIDGCRRFVLANSIFDSDDDAICLKSTGTSPCEDVVITNCIASSYCNGIKMGTESTGGFKNININNCIVKPTRCETPPTGNKFGIGITGLSLEIVDGGTMEGVTVSNLTINGTMCPIYIRLGGRSRKHIAEAPEPQIGTLRNVTISNITAYNSGNWACSITGIPDHKVENIRLDNINIIQKGGLKKGDYLATLNDVKEDIKGYPQPTVWKKLPCSGMFIRHAKDISVTNFSLNTLEPDPRPVFLADDVEGLRINTVNVGANCNQKELLVKNNVSNSKIKF